MDKWINKMQSIYTMEYYSALKKDIHILQHEGNKDIMLSETNQTQKHKYCMISLILGT